MLLDQVFNHCNIADRTLHMSQGWFVLNGHEAPELPITLPFSGAPYGYHRNKLIICSPFSRSDNNNNKLWPHERWVDLLRRITRDGRRVLVIGSGVEDWEPYYEFDCAKDMTLCGILELLRECDLFLSIDNGISHLAHFGGVAQHLLLMPECLSPSFICNPRGYNVRGNPIDIGVDSVESLAKEMLYVV